MKPFNGASAAALALLTFSLTASAADWPQWRGPDRDDLSKEKGLLKKWPANGPKRVWMYENGGNGYSGPAIVDGKLYTIGTRGDEEILIALDANTGKELWATGVGTILANDWGNGPRSTPTVDGKHVYALGGKGDLTCFTAKDGKKVWTRTATELGGKRPNWGYTESVLVDGKMVVFTPGGSQGAIVALDKETGSTVWQSKDFTDDAHYSSIIPIDFNGKHQFVQLTMKSVVGIEASTGKMLWRSDWLGKTAVIPTPIYKDGHVFVTSGYGVGCKLIKLGPGNTATDVYENKNFVNHHGGVVLVGDYLYGHSDTSGWMCQDFKTGETMWKDKSVLGKGAVSYADGMLYCLEEKTGTVVLVEASPKGWSEQSRFKLDPQTSIRAARGMVWTHPVVINGKLYLRDQNLIYCYDVKTAGPVSSAK